MTQARSREEVLQRDRDDLHKLVYAQDLPLDGRFQQPSGSALDHLDPDRRGNLYDYAWPGRAPPRCSSAGHRHDFFVLIAASMVEIASAYPTAAASRLASRRRTRNVGC